MTEFLLARIAEDEAWEAEHPHFGDVTAPEYVPPWWTRTRAECEAKRRIVRECQEHETCGGGYDECSEAALLTLRHLAAVHADHPDYCDEWRP